MKTFTLSVLMAASQAIQLKDDDVPDCLPGFIVDDIIEQCEDPDNVDNVVVDSDGEEYDCDLALGVPVCSGSDEEGSGSGGPPSCLPESAVDYIWDECMDSDNVD